MYTTGLVSVTFRDESVETVINATAQAGLSSIEWGGDVHVPPGDLKNAQRVAALTKQAGLSVSAYGSYYRIGEYDQPQEEFKKILQAAVALDAPIIRLWAGSMASSGTSEDKRKVMVSETQQLAQIADSAGIDIALECHLGTLTDDWHSSLKFLKEVGSPRLQMYWQPSQLHDNEYNLKAATELAPYTVNVHVFHWDLMNRYPLSEGEDIWKQYLDIFRKTGKDYGLLLEFMHNDQLDALPETAQILMQWIR